MVRVTGSLNEHMKPVSFLSFGELFAKDADRVIGDATWLHIQTANKQGWVVGWISSTLVNCVDTAQWEHHPGPIPDFAYCGQSFPHADMFTEGYSGTADLCVVSASGDNMWRELNIELLFRGFATATVFEKQWGGSADFTDWVAHYALNVGAYAGLASGEQKRLFVTVKNTARHREFPRADVDPVEVKDAIGRAQLKECVWLKNICDKKALSWDDTTFLTTFQFLKRFCNWNELDCQLAASNKAERVLSSVAQAVSQPAQGEGSLAGADPDDCQDSAHLHRLLETVRWCLDEAYGGKLPDNMQAILERMKQFQDEARRRDEEADMLMQRLTDSSENARNMAIQRLRGLGDGQRARAVKLVLDEMKDVMQDTSQMLQASLCNRNSFEDSWQLRTQAVDILRMHRSEAAVVILDGILVMDPTFLVRLAAAVALVQIGGEASHPGLSWLAACLRDPKSWQEAQVVVETLGAAKVCGAELLLREVLHESIHPPVRQEAASALGKLGTPTCVQALRQARDTDGHILVKWAAEDALEEIQRGPKRDQARPPKHGHRSSCRSM